MTELSAVAASGLRESRDLAATSTSTSCMAPQ